MNFRTRLQILDEVGLGDIMASHVSMWTLGRTFLATAAGRAQMDKLFASVRKNSPERYRAFIQTILRFGRCEPDQAGLPKLTSRLGEIRAPTRVICGAEDIMTPPRAVGAHGRAYSWRGVSGDRRMRAYYIYRKT